MKKIALILLIVFSNCNKGKIINNLDKAGGALKRKRVDNIEKLINRTVSTHKGIETHALSELAKCLAEDNSQHFLSVLDKVNGTSLLQNAIYSGAIKAALLIIDKTPLSIIKIKGKSGNSTLHFIACCAIDNAYYSDKEVAKLVDKVIKKVHDSQDVANSRKLLFDKENKPEDKDISEYINCINENGWTALHYAAMKNNLLVAQKLIKNGIDINKKNKKGETAIYIAVKHQQTNMFDYLMDEGANINIATDFDFSPIALAVSSNNEYMFNKLLEKTENIEEKYLLALINISIEQNVNESIFNKLIEKAENIEEKYLLILINISIKKNAKESVFNKLVEKIENIEEQNLYSLLKLSIIENVYDKFFISFLQKRNLTKRYVDNLLYKAVEKNRLSLLKILVEKYKDIIDLNTFFHVSVEGREPQTKDLLLLASENNNIDILKYLIDKGANNGHYAVQYSIRNNNYSIFSFLISHNLGMVFKIYDENNSLLHYAAYHGNIQVVKYLLSKNLDINLINEEGETPLTIAMFKQYDNIAELLIDKGADVNIVLPNGNTPLTIALFKRYEDIAKLLIEKGADVNTVLPNGNTPLTIALFKRYEDIAKLLIEKGVDVNIDFPNGETYLSLALSKDYVDVAEMLIKAGINPNTVVVNGNTPLFNAICYLNMPMVDMLMNNGAEIDGTLYEGKTYLHLAIERSLVDGENDTELLEKILNSPFYQNGNNLEIKNEKGVTALFSIVEMSFCAAEENTAIKFIQLLVERGADLRTTDDRGFDLLYTTCIENMHFVLEYFLDCHKNIFKQLIDNRCIEDDSNTPLHRAVINENYVIVTILLRHGANYNIQNFDENTPFQLINHDERTNNEQMCYDILKNYIDRFN